MDRMEINYSKDNSFQHRVAKIDFGDTMCRYHRIGPIMTNSLQDQQRIHTQKNRLYAYGRTFIFYLTVVYLYYDTLHGKLRMLEFIAAGKKFNNMANN